MNGDGCGEWGARMRLLRRWWNRLTGYRFEMCQRCERPVGPCTGSWWHADDELWFEVMHTTAGVLCPPCFTAACDALGIRLFWHARVEYRDGEDVLEGQRRAGLRP